MSRLRILLAAILCVSLLTFAGCGEKNNTDTNGDNGTVTEDSTDMNNGDGSMMDDMEKGAEDMVDGLEKDAKDAADGMKDAVDGNNGEGPSNRDKNTKGSN